jgi:hypothetical protein
MTLIEKINQHFYIAKNKICAHDQPTTSCEECLLKWVQEQAEMAVKTAEEATKAYFKATGKLPY